MIQMLYIFIIMFVVVGTFSSSSLKILAVSIYTSIIRETLCDLMTLSLIKENIKILLLCVFIFVTIILLNKKKKIVRNFYMTILIIMSVLLANMEGNFLQLFLWKYNYCINYIVIGFSIMNWLLKGKTPGKDAMRLEQKYEERLSIFDYLYKNYIKILSLPLSLVHIYHYLKKGEIPCDEFTLDVENNKEENIIKVKNKLLKQFIAFCILFFCVFSITTIIYGYLWRNLWDYVFYWSI